MTTNEKNLAIDFTKLRATMESIIKWDDIATGKGVDKAQDNCALCKEYLRLGCKGCPVAENTAPKKNCYGTPYRDLWLPNSTQKDEDDYYKGKVPAGQKGINAALAERNYLAGLLPAVLGITDVKTETVGAVKEVPEEPKIPAEFNLTYGEMVQRHNKDRWIKDVKSGSTTLSLAHWRLERTLRKLYITTARFRDSNY